jgi:hypothetical protein
VCGDIAAQVIKFYSFKMDTDMAFYHYNIQLPSEIRVDFLFVIIFTFLLGYMSFVTHPLSLCGIS